MKNALLPAAVCALALLPSPFAPRAQTTTAQRLPRSTAATTFVAAADATPAERSAADLRCDGVRDEVELQAAIDALRGHGGRVALSSGTFLTSAPVEVTGRLQLTGQGQATVVRAANDFAGVALVTGTYTGQGDPLDLFALSDLTLHGSRFQAVQCGGVFLDMRSSAGFQQGSPDAFVRIADLLVTQCAGHGVHLTGGANRAARVREVRVWDVDGDGFRVECPDSKLTDCDAGSSGGAGFRILGANALVSGCKGWYSDDSGFVIDAVRGSYDGCSAQDNALHGFDVRAGLNSFSGCHADSNSYAGGANPAANAGLYDGFHVAASNVTLAASLAYDKDEGGRGRNQRYGLFVAPGRVRINAQIATGNGSSHDNLVGGVGGAVAGAGTRIVATGQTDLGW